MKGGQGYFCVSFEFKIYYSRFNLASAVHHQSKLN